MDDCSTLGLLAQQHCDRLQLPKLAKRVQVSWNPRMRSTAGRAFFNESKIELNPKLLEISETELHRTLLHELAHLVAHHRHPRRRIAPHGVQWQQACADLGIPGERATHRLPLPSRKLTRPWLYTCPSCEQSITRTRRIKRKVACHPCCKQHNNSRFSSKFALIESYQTTH